MKMMKSEHFYTSIRIESYSSKLTYLFLLKVLMIIKTTAYDKQGIRGDWFIENINMKLLTIKKRQLRKNEHKKEDDIKMKLWEANENRKY